MSQPGNSLNQAGKSSTIRLLALVQRPPDRAPNQRFRHEQWAPWLERQHGIAMDFAAFESPELGALMDVPGRRGVKLLYVLRDCVRLWLRRHDASRYDAVVVLREASLLGGAFMERAIVSQGIPLIYDFDDAIYLSRPDGARRLNTLYRMPQKVATISRISTAVTVGSEYLAPFARLHNANVYVVPTSIDLERYPVQPERGTTPFTVAWSGSRSTLQYLDLARPALSALAARVPFRLRVICNSPPRPFDGIPVDFVPWSPAIEVSALAGADVGIMPLPDTETARGKCALKALQYMAVGRAAVVSPVGANSIVVRHNENGLLARDTQDWVTQLERLARDPALRRRLAVAGRRTVEAEYSAELSARKFAHVVQVVRGDRHSSGEASPDPRLL